MGGPNESSERGPRQLADQRFAMQRNLIRGMPGDATDAGANTGVRSKRSSSGTPHERRFKTEAAYDTGDRIGKGSCASTAGARHSGRPGLRCKGAGAHGPDLVLFGTELYVS